MKIINSHSHLNAMDFLFIQRPALWREIQEIVAKVSPQGCSHPSPENNQELEAAFDPAAVSGAFKQLFDYFGWSENCVRGLENEVSMKNQNVKNSGVHHDADQPAFTPMNPIELQSDFVKDRVAVKVHFDHAPHSCASFANHLASFVRDEIDVGIEILPMKALQSQMSSGVAYYEGEFYNVIRNGRGVPSVPLVLIGIDV